MPRDLEVITLTCLAKEPSKRYADAGALAADLDRFLRREPIRARPAGHLTQLRYWCRRKPGTALLLASLGGLLLLTAIGSSVAAARFAAMRRHEAELRQESERRLRQGEELIRFMLGDLAERLEPVGRLDVLDSTLREVDGFYAKLPGAEQTADSQRNRAQSLMQMANIRTLQGRFDEAYPLFQRSIDGYKELVHAYPENLDWQSELTRVINDLATAYAMQQKNDKARLLFEDCLARRRSLVDKAPDNITYARNYGISAQNLAITYRRLKDLPRAAEMIDIAEKSMRRWGELEPTSTLARERLGTVLGTHASILERLDRLEEAAHCLNEQQTLLRGILAKDPRNSRTQNALVLCQGAIGDLELNRSHPEEAAAALREGLRIADQLIQAEPGNKEFQLPRINQLDNLAMAYQPLHRDEEALAACRRLWDLSQQDPTVLKSYPSWADNCRQSQEVAEQILVAQAEKAAGEGRTELVAKLKTEAAEFHARVAALSAKSP